ncbi:hypothetical protein [Halalkalicoccus subterraneus]|uniref:hypothetical protein n=1 Tax=Halalkalicoccus subterraneus TaxID=2675002 RepID=UPI000EFC8D93|nr:hypothetical protein [Halalkalicoccus subterraneus]
MSLGQSLTDDEPETDPDVTTARVDLLEAENDRLRRELAQARQARYRRAAFGTGLVGLVAIVGAFFFPVASTVLFALGGTGLFTALLIRYLTPERFVSATVGRRIYEALATDHESLTNELGLGETQLYTPIDTDSNPAVRLFVPQQTEYSIPDDEELDSVLVLPADDRGRGVAFEPTGDALVDELRSATNGDLGSDLDVLAGQLADGLVEVFELVDGATPNTDPENGRLSVEVSGSAYGPVDRFDHPVASTVATAVAAERTTPVELDVTETEDGNYVVTCREL